MAKSNPIYYGIVIKDVTIYENWSLTSAKLGTITNGTSITVYNMASDGSYVWVRHNAGWSIANDKTGEMGQTIALRQIVDNAITLEPDNGNNNDNDNDNSNTDNNDAGDNSGGDSGGNPDQGEEAPKKDAETTTASNKTMRLFGSPFQFTEYTDHRVAETSSFFGRKYAERVVAHAPYITIIPGDADYLGNETGIKKQEDSAIILGRIFADDSDNGISFEDSPNKTEETRYYNFKQNYSGYIDRVNLTLRTMAVMLGLGDTALPVYNSATEVTNVALAQYDWGNYRWDASSYSFGNTLEGAVQGDNIIDAGTNAIDITKKDMLARIGSSNIVFAAIFSHHVNKTEDQEGEETLEDNKLANTYTTRNYIQFYIDPTATDSTDTLSNRTEESKLRGIFESQQSTIKEMAFIANTSGMDVDTFGDAVGTAINDAMGTFSGGGLKGILGRVAQAAGNVIKGENIVLPDVYQSSSRDTSSRSFKINLYSPYGNPLSIFLNILVPIGFLICLTAPANKSANSYESPPLVKVFYDGVYSCSLGIVQSLQIARDSADWTADGLPTSAIVNLEIKDLYTDLSVNSASEDVNLFMHNSSLIEFLLTQCGLSMISYNFELKAKLRWNTTANLSGSSFHTIGGRLSENILGNIVNKFNSVL